jgi:AraC-like DNA-binding protein
MDQLANLITAARTGPATFAHADLVSPWGMRFERGNKIGFHVVLRGACYLRAGRGESMRLEAGGVAILPRGWTHTLSDAPNRPAVPYHLVPRQPVASTAVDASLTRLFCGGYPLDRTHGIALVSFLPPVIYAPRDSGSNGQQTARLLELLVNEVRSSGSDSLAVADRLADALFLSIIRGWVEKQAEYPRGWVAGFRDPHTARALRLMHDHPGRQWTVGTLARGAGLSRPAFARKFRELIGQSPLEYLTEWRMTLAARLLRDTDRMLADIAAESGYSSAFAFSKAFKRWRGMSPSRYRGDALDSAS